jgi:hypothetical protein
VPTRRTAHSEHCIGGYLERNTKRHITVQNQLINSTLTKFQTLTTFLTIRVTAIYKKYLAGNPRVINRLLTAVQRLSLCPYKRDSSQKKKSNKVKSSRRVKKFKQRYGWCL